jgi:hypothetical protein
MSNDKGMTKFEDVRDVSPEVPLECGGAPLLLIDAGAPQGKRRGDASALPKLSEMILISHSSFCIISSFVIRHSSFL